MSTLTEAPLAKRMNGNLYITKKTIYIEYCPSTLVKQAVHLRLRQIPPKCVDVGCPIKAKLFSQASILLAYTRTVEHISVVTS
ncbi:hypothetical protein NP493_208g03030 [Ridgeia piscesae]|uniref:Uncharacterized protein n=1 Tax=Ridgeia piscesae TaxID=27915 RepID=A0AAD9P158_RIDPI|nr:hypothetical protein NP493_208g03030 [Ridgeia piscesae]